MEWLYSTKFISGTPLICWFAIGVFGQVISWPLGFIQIARGASRAFIITQSLFNSLHFGLIAVLYPLFGVLGVGISFVALYVIYTLSMLAYAKRTTGFIWSPSVRRLIVMNGVLISIGFLIAFFASGLSYTLLGFLLAVFGGLFCARELARRLPETHRYWKILIKITTLVNFRKKF
jgi:PST family polysaccharide transporter